VKRFLVIEIKNENMKQCPLFPKGPKGEKVLEVYAQQKTSSAYRVFWYYGPERGMITIVAIAPHH